MKNKDFIKNIIIIILSAILIFILLILLIKHDSSGKAEMINYSQSEKDCSLQADKIKDVENNRLGNTFPNDDDHNNYVVYIKNHFNRRDNKCYVYYEDYKRAPYQKGLNFRSSNNADNFFMSRLLDAYEGRNIIGCGAGTFSNGDDGCIYWAKDSTDIGGAEDPNSEFNLQVYDYYMSN